MRVNTRDRRSCQTTVPRTASGPRFALADSSPAPCYANTSDRCHGALAAVQVLSQAVHKQLTEHENEDPLRLRQRPLCPWLGAQAPPTRNTRLRQRHKGRLSDPRVLVFVSPQSLYNLYLQPRGCVSMRGSQGPPAASAAPRGLVRGRCTSRFAKCKALFVGQNLS